MTNLIIALIAAVILLGVGVALHGRIMAAIKALHADFLADAQAVHSRLAAVEQAVTKKK